MFRKKIRTLYALFGLCFLGFLFLNSSGGVASIQGVDRTGSPVSFNPCNNCHGGGNFAATASLVVTDGMGNAVSSYTPGAVYTLTYTITSSGASAHGMQATALLGNNASAGSISSPSSNAQVVALNSRQYLEHQGASSSNTFTATWTAPSNGSGTVTFYGSALAVNGTGGTGGDQYTNIPNLSLTEQGTLSSDASLSDLSSNGSTVNGFSSGTLSYSIQLPAGTTTVPTVTATTTDPNASFVVNNAPSLPGTTDVVVTAEDGTTTQTYSIAYTVAANNDASLSDLQSDGQTVAGFSSSTLSYSIQLPTGTTTVPTVTATPTDPNASLSINAASSLPGTTDVVVTAADGVTTQTYSVTYTVAANNDASLSDLQSDGQTVPGFSSSTLSYSIQLPAGTTIVPTVTATASDPNASLSINAASNLPGTTDVVVTAADGVTTQTYSVAYTVAANNDASLSDLQSDGQTVAGFSSSVFNYTIQLPAGTTIVPTVTATASDPNANVSIVAATNLPGTTEAIVTAEDGVTTQTYSISFELLTSQSEALGFSYLQLAPNRVQYQLQLQVRSLQHRSVQARISNSIGQVLRQFSLEVPLGSSQWSWDVADLPQGWYQLELGDQENRTALRFYKY